MPRLAMEKEHEEGRDDEINPRTRGIRTISEDLFDWSCLSPSLIEQRWAGITMAVGSLSMEECTVHRRARSILSRIEEISKKIDR